MKDKTLEELNSNHIAECPCFYCERLDASKFEEEVEKFEKLEEQIIKILKKYSNALSKEEQNKKFGGPFRRAD